MNTKEKYVAPNNRPGYKPWQPGTYTPQYSDRPPGNYTSQIPTSLNGYAHCILPPTDDRGGLYLGSEEGQSIDNLSILQETNIGLIINATPRYPNHHEKEKDISYIRVRVNDEPSATLLPWFDGISERIQFTLSSNRSVFVHCQMGISRSSTLVMAYLMRYQQATRDMAYQHTKEIRPKVEPNIGFWAQLKEYEQRLANRSSDTNANGNGNTDTNTKTDTNTNTNADSSGETKTNHETTAVSSMRAFLKENNLFNLNQSVIDFQCLHTSQRDQIYESIEINDSMAIDAALLESLNLIYDTPSDDRLVWFKQLVKLIGKENEVGRKLAKESTFMNDYWSGEWNESKVNKILNALR